MTVFKKSRQSLRLPAGPFLYSGCFPDLYDGLICRSYDYLRQYCPIVYPDVVYQAVEIGAGRVVLIDAYE